jgi:hypothetical protein
MSRSIDRLENPTVLGHLPASSKMPTPADVIARLQVLLIEKRAAEAAITLPRRLLHFQVALQPRLPRNGTT